MPERLVGGLSRSLGECSNPVQITAFPDIRETNEQHSEKQQGCQRTEETNPSRSFRADYLRFGELNQVRHSEDVR